MWSIGFQTINGMMLGIEFPPVLVAEPEDKEEDEPDVTFAIVIDIFIFRFILMKIKE
jgi:hypothetical protein